MADSGSPNPPAFPRAGIDAPGQNGMTLRDYFAGQALIPFLEHWGFSKERSHRIAESCYEVADALLAYRAQE